MTRIFHIATRSDWEAARESGTYTTSTLGRTLEDEGFIHASRREQVKGIHAAIYGDVDEDLFLLTIDPARLTDAEVREEPVGEETYPHVYGPINTSAVVAVEPMNRRGGTDSFAMVMLKEMARRMALATAAMVAIVVLVVAATWLLER